MYSGVGRKKNSDRIGLLSTRLRLGSFIISKNTEWANIFISFNLFHKALYKVTLAHRTALQRFTTEALTGYTQSRRHILTPGLSISLFSLDITNHLTKVLPSHWSTANAKNSHKCNSSNNESRSW